MTTKVKQTEAYKDSQGEHIVCKGKLVLLNGNDIKKGKIRLSDNINISKIPLIISKEKIDKGDYIWCVQGQELVQWDYETQPPGECFAWKVLALPENFSPKHLQAIVDGKLKDGDEVYVETHEQMFKCCGDGVVNGIGHWCAHCKKKPLVNTIKLTNNHIKLFPIKKEEGWDDTWTAFIKTDAYKVATDTSEVLAWYKRFLKQNYNPPTKK